MNEKSKPDLLDCGSTSKVTGGVCIDLMIATMLIKKYPDAFKDTSLTAIRDFSESLKEQLGRTPGALVSNLLLLLAIS